MSVLEHVYDREDFFLMLCSQLLKESGFCAINYDNGHFFDKRQWEANIFGKILGRFTPLKQWYQDYVDEKHIMQLIKKLRFKKKFVSSIIISSVIRNYLQN